MPRKIQIIFFLFFNLLFFGNNSETVGYEEDIRLIVGETRIISSLLPSRVIIGNPKVADITEVTNSEITISAKSPGVTKLIFWDSFGEQSVNIKVVQEDMQVVKERVDNILEKLALPEVYTRAEDEEAKVLILGRVKNPQDKERIAFALSTLKDKIVDLIEVKEEESIIEIDVQVLELNKDATSTLGLTWPGSISLVERGSPGIADAGSKWSTLFKVFNLQRATISGSTVTSNPFTFKLDALIQEGKARVLSRPRLACQSGKEAQLLVGGEKPILTTQTVTGGAGAQGTAVQYKEFGIKLNIKPTIMEESRIKLGVNVEVSDVGDVEILGKTTEPTAKAFPLTKRTAATELYLHNGQTMAIGGLIKQKTEEELRKFPWLSDIPVLGLFFRQKTTKIGKGFGSKDDTELFITLTPTVVSKEVPKDKRVSAQRFLPRETEPFKDLDMQLDLVNYIKAVQSKILNVTFYPAQARDAGWEGNVKLILNITANGYLKQARVTQSSGYKVLDDAALEVAHKSAPYPPFPPEVIAEELWVDVPIIYKKN
jgi:pilus assembly protein CpaC